MLKGIGNTCTDQEKTWQDVNRSSQWLPKFVTISQYLCHAICTELVTRLEYLDISNDNLYVHYHTNAINLIRRVENEFCSVACLFQTRLISNQNMTQHFFLYKCSSNVLEIKTYVYNPSGACFVIINIAITNPAAWFSINTRTRILTFSWCHNMEALSALLAPCIAIQ